MGDSTDGYKGCPGYGIVKSEKLIDSRKEFDVWPAIWGAFASKDIGYGEALKQAQVSRILQTQDYVDGKVILWQEKT